MRPWDNAIVAGAPENDATENVTSIRLHDEYGSCDDDGGHRCAVSEHYTLLCAASAVGATTTTLIPSPILRLQKATHPIDFISAPNTLIMGKQVFDKLKHHPDLLNG